MGKGSDISLARKHINKVEAENINIGDITTPSSDSAYYQQAYPEGYGSELSSRSKKRVSASNKNLNLFTRMAAGFYKIHPENVRTASIALSEKADLLKHAKSAWEIRAETDDEGVVSNYFVLREDIEAE